MRFAPVLFNRRRLPLFTVNEVLAIVLLELLSEIWLLLPRTVGPV